MCNLKHTSLWFGMAVLSMLNASPVLAYEFGVPPVTEITDNGTSRGRTSLFFLGDEGKYMGVSGSYNFGNQFGASSYMYRAGTSSYAEPSGAYTRSGTFFGVGKGWEWDLMADRHVGLIGNLQFDLKNSSNSGGSSDTATGTAFGFEVGGLYRHFMENNTLTSFVLLNMVNASDSVKHTSATTAAYYDQLNVYHPAVVGATSTTSTSKQSSSIAIGADYMVGRASLTAALALGSGNTTGSKMSLLIAAGYNY